MWKLNCDFENNEYKFEQLRDEIIKIIESGEIELDKPLPTIYKVSNHYKLSSVTVGRAYHQLQKLGYITKVNKNFFLTTEKIKRLKILLVFNKLEYNKREIYEAIQDVFNGSATIDLQVYYSNYNTFKTIISESLNKYDYYIIMPHFYQVTQIEDDFDFLKNINQEKLLFIDRIIPGVRNFCGAVIQDFDADVFSSLEKAKTLLLKYNEIRFLVGEHSHHPVESIHAIKRFCNENHMKFGVINNMNYESITPHTVYMVTTEKSLAQLIKKIKSSVYSLGKDVGIISYNETILNELLNVTVFSTNFYQMGEIAAKMIVNKQYDIVKNSFDVIVRESL